jgi:L-asparaginase/beta-aspartyl-peptidase (threonine type)
LQDRDGCVAAAQAGLDSLLDAGDTLQAAVQAAVRAVTVLEDDPRFNAGTGSALRMDGATIEMDAAVMDSLGQLGAVAGVRRVRHPVQLAALVTRTPHWLLCGEGALRFARTQGMEDHDPVTVQATIKHRELLARLQRGKQLQHGVDNAAFTDHWNFAAPPAITPGAPCDTVGAVVRDGAGNFAVAASTGGCSPALLGRVGDTPIIGAGFYAGTAGAVAVTGIGEQIVRHLLAFRVHQWLAEDMPLDNALQRALALFDPAIDIGLIAVNAHDSGARSNRDMPSAMAQGTP